jgi:hypothetical protein
MSRDHLGFVLIVGAIGLSVAVAWWLCYVARVEWFRVRLVEGDRTQRMIGMLPIVIPACIVLALIL